MSELETLDSELVMSFYDQYHTEDLSKVYEDLSEKLEDSGVTDLKNNSITSSLSIDLNHSPPPGVSSPGGQIWNLPDLLVGLDSLQRLPSSSRSPLHEDMSASSTSISSVASTSSSNLIPSTQSILQSYNNFMNTSPPLELSKNSISDFRTINIEHFNKQNTDSILEGLGISLNNNINGMSQACSSSIVKNEPLASSLLHPQGLDLDLEISPFELSLKSEPGLVNNNLNCTVNTTPISIPQLSTFPSFAGHLSTLDILNTAAATASLQGKLDGVGNSLTIAGPGLTSLDPMIAEHCTLLPPELVADQSVLLPASLRNANIVATVDDITDHAGSISEAASHTFLLQDQLKEEEEESIEKPVEVEANPSYKRCHLCVRIFSTKANLSSHIRHVHLGETKHSRVKSIPCPHCHKMFSRKGHMTEHVRTVHEGKKRIYKEVNCQHCGKTFRRKWGLNIHISSAHADVVSSLLKQ